MLPHGRDLRLAFTVRVAFRTPHVSGTGDAHCISRGFIFLSNCVVQRMRVWSLPALLFFSEPVCRSVGRRPEARAHRGEATRPHPLRHPSRRISLGSRRSSARCARTAPDSPSAWFPCSSEPETKGVFRDGHYGHYVTSTMFKYSRTSPGVERVPQ